MSLTIPGSNFKLKNNNLFSTIKENISEIIYEPTLFQKYHIRF